FHSAESELDPVKRAALFIAMNDMVVEAGVVIPVVWRPQVSAISRKLRATLSGWDSTFWNLKDWYREARWPAAGPMTPLRRNPPLTARKKPSRFEISNRPPL